MEAEKSHVNRMVDGVLEHCSVWVLAITISPVVVVAEKHILFTHMFAL